jgi:hypothetical protein
MTMVLMGGLGAPWSSVGGGVGAGVGGVVHSDAAAIVIAMMNII